MPAGHEAVLPLLVEVDDELELELLLDVELDPPFPLSTVDPQAAASVRRATSATAPAHRGGHP